MATITVIASKDTKVSSGSPDTNYGTENFLRIDNGYYNEFSRTLLEFDFSTFLNVPYHFIDNIILHVYVTTLYGTQAAVDVQRTDTDSWTESGVTWNNQPASTDFNIEATWTTSGWKTVVITNIIKQALADGNSVAGILLKYLSEDDAENILNIFATEYGSNRPYISVAYDNYSQTRLKGSLCKNLLDRSGWGEITMTDHNCPTGDAATFTFKTEWGTTYTTAILDVGETVEYTSGTKHHSFKLYSMSCNSAPCDNLAAATIEEKFWDTGNAYVKTDGDNDRNGRSWAEAWGTITHAANEVFDGQDVRIGFGTYNSETDVTPDNVGPTGIRYTPETAGTGGGTGSVTINM